MHTLTLPTATVILHNSPETLPESRRVKHEYYSLIESGIGSSRADIARHFEQMIGLVGCEDHQAQMNAINNTYFLFVNLLGQQYSSKSLALCCLVETIDGETWKDFTADGVEALARFLSDKGLTDQIITDTLGPVKKNSGVS